MFYRESLLFRSGGRSNYRIPSIIADKHGTLYAFCNERFDTLVDHAAETGLKFSRKLPGKEWEEPIDLVHIPDWGCMIGSAIYDEETDTVMCSVYKIAVMKDEFGYYSEADLERMAKLAREKERAANTKQGDFLILTKDGGNTWQEIPLNVEKTEFVHIDGRHLLRGGQCHGSAHGIQLHRGTHAGRLVYPSRMATDSFHTVKDLLTTNYNNAIYSDDHGLSWKTSLPVQIGTGEGTLIENRDGTLTYNSRAYFNDCKRYLATSCDGAETWGNFRTDDVLIEPPYGCNATLLRVECERIDGLPPRTDGIVLFSNPRSDTRKNMTIMVSLDGGNSWTIEKTIRKGPSAYSSLDFDHVSQRFFLLYELGVNNEYDLGIAVTEFDLEWLLS